MSETDGKRGIDRGRIARAGCSKHKLGGRSHSPRHPRQRDATPNLVASSADIHLFTHRHGQVSRPKSSTGKRSFTIGFPTASENVARRSWRLASLGRTARPRQ